MSKVTGDTRIKDIMSVNPQCIGPDSTLKEASVKMKEINAGFLPVCENDKLTGVVTDRDIVVGGIAKGLSPDSYVREVMTKDIIYCFDDESLEEGANKMEKGGVRRIVVLSRDKRLTGVLSLDDIATKAGIESMVTGVLKQVNKEIVS